MRVIPVALMSILVLWLGGGCKREDPTQNQPQANNPPLKPEPPKANPNPPKVKPQPKLSALARRMDLPEVRHYMGELGKAYKLYELDHNKAPSKQQDLSPYYQRVAKIEEPLSKGWWIFIYNVAPRQMSEGPANTILAYEAEADANAIRVCLMGDGTTRTMEETTFNAAPKAGR